MSKYFVRIETASAEDERFSGIEPGTKCITGCTEDRELAEREYGFGGYYAVYADSSHKVRYEAERAGFMS